MKLRLRLTDVQVYALQHTEHGLLKEHMGLGCYLGKFQTTSSSCPRAVLATVGQFSRISVCYASEYVN